MSVFPSLAFLTGSVGAGEWVVLFVVVLIVVGPKRLPEIARKLGRTMEMFRRAADEFKEQIMTMDQEPPLPPSAPAPSDADGVAHTEESPYSESYSDAYPDIADYPGNEDAAAQAPAESPPEAPAPDSSGNAAAPAEAPASGTPPETPAEGGA